MVCNPGSCSFLKSIGQKDRDIGRARGSSGKLTEAEREKTGRLFMPFESYCFVKKRALHTKKCVV